MDIQQKLLDSYVTFHNSLEKAGLPTHPIAIGVLVLCEALHEFHESPAEEPGDEEE